MSWQLIVKQKFSAAHFLKNHKGKCERLHGHTFEVEARFRVEKLDASGISIDFSDLKEYIKKLVPDHQALNEVYPFSPSAENLSRYFYQQLADRYPVQKVIVWESDDAGAEYSEDQ